MPSVEDGTLKRETSDVSLIQEIKDAESSGKHVEILKRYGAPVALTYLFKIRGAEPDDLMKHFKSYVSKMNETAAGRAVIKEICIASINGSPYPKEFIGLNWRECSQMETSYLRSEPWWRDTDYKGVPLEKYQALLKENI
jgi:hypothetical protein